MFVKIYEDNAAGRLNDDRYEMLSRMYEDEQKKLEAEVIRLRREIDEQETKHEELERFIEKAKAYVGIRKLDGYILHELVKAIYVESPRRVDGKKEQRIHIEYNGIGFIPIYDLIEQESGVTEVTPDSLKTVSFQLFDLKLCYEQLPNQELLFILPVRTGPGISQRFRPGCHTPG